MSFQFQNPYLARPCIPLVPPNNSVMDCYRAPPPSPIMIPQGKTQRKNPCPSPHCIMLLVDQRIEMLVMTPKSPSRPTNIPVPSIAPAPSQEVTLRRKALSVDTPPSPSPLHQVSSAEDEDDTTTITVSIPSSSCYSETETLFNDAPSRRRFTLPSFRLKPKELRLASSSTIPEPEPEPSSPISPTMTERSTAPLFPCSPKTPHQPINNLKISTPLDSSSSIDATIRSSITNPPNPTDKSSSLPSTIPSTKAKSWPGRRRRPLTIVGEDEKNTTTNNNDIDTDDPKSRFSDSEDENDGRTGTKKGFRRRLSETFGCFRSRKY